MALLFIKPLSTLFFILYILCGFSDFLDGYIARKMETNSQFGATLDSISDAIFIGVILVTILPLLHLSWWILLWIGGIALVRLISLAIGFIKYRTMAFLHTYANKATGFILFCFPLLYGIFGLTIAAFLVSTLASISAFEELVINTTSKKLNRNIRHITLKKVKSHY